MLKYGGESCGTEYEPLSKDEVFKTIKKNRNIVKDSDMYKQVSSLTNIVTHMEYAYISFFFLGFCAITCLFMKTNASQTLGVCIIGNFIFAWLVMLPIILVKWNDMISSIDDI